MATIQVLKPKFHIDECLEQIRECLEKGWTGSGFKTAEFEKKWKEYTGHANACYLNSNTAGLHLASQAPLRLAGRGRDHLQPHHLCFHQPCHYV